MRFDVRDNIPEFLRSLTEHNRQVRFATAVALTRTAKLAEAAEIEEMPKVFDRPRPSTLKALRTKTASKADLTAEVMVKDWIGKGNAPIKYLTPEVLGGGRRQKRSERAIVSTFGWLSGYWVPGAGLKLDAYGNVSAALMVRILADIQAAESHAGYLANRTKRSLKRNRNYRKERYFVPLPGTPLYNVAPGVWVRRGGKVLPALIFVSTVSYRRRFDFYGKGERFVRKTFPVQLAEALRMAFATAR